MLCIYPAKKRTIRFPALSSDQALVCQRHESIHLLSHHHLRRSDDDMPLSRFLPLPQKDRRSRSKVKSEADASQDPSGAGSAVPRLTESDSEVGTASSTSTTATPLTVQNWVSGGTMRTTLSWKESSPDFSSVMCRQHRS